MYECKNDLLVFSCDIIISNLYPRLKKTNDPDVHNCSENFQYLNSESVRLYLFEYYYYRTTLLNSDSLTHLRR